MTRSDLQQIPSINELTTIIRRRGIASTEASATVIARRVQQGTRQALLSNPAAALWPELDRQLGEMEGLMRGGRYRPVINATGILVHTNLGRAAVSVATGQAMEAAATSSASLEIDPDTGRRGGRMVEIETLLNLLTGAEAALVVNNNAAGILLTLSALASGRAVAVSRAEAVEIGGGFRIPDVLAQSGARLVEIGTTNRTYARDYRHSGIGSGDAILRVHASNFSVVGFTARAATEELRQVADDLGATLIEDLGSGTLIDTAVFGIEHEPTIQESLQAGVDVVTFSGDKLLGGPQAGIIAGRKDLIARIASHPLARAVRADKTALAGLSETLRHYVRGDHLDEIPLLRSMSVSRDELTQRAGTIAESLGVPATSIDTTNHVGGGALPGQALPGRAVRLVHPPEDADAIARSLRIDGERAVYGRIEQGAVLLELRTVLPEHDEDLVETVRRVMAPYRPTAP